MTKNPPWKHCEKPRKLEPWNRRLKNKIGFHQQEYSSISTAAQMNFLESVSGPRLGAAFARRTKTTRMKIKHTTIKMDSDQNKAKRTELHTELARGRCDWPSGKTGLALSTAPEPKTGARTLPRAPKTIVPRKIKTRHS
jgi:hypothetical protein